MKEKKNNDNKSTKYRFSKTATPVFLYKRKNKNVIESLTLNGPLFLFVGRGQGAPPIYTFL